MIEVTILLSRFNRHALFFLFKLHPMCCIVKQCASLDTTHCNAHCKNEPVILTLIWLHEFQCCIDNKYYACEV